VCGLHVGVTKLLHALCEGNDRYAEDRILAQFQLDEIAKLSKRYYEKWHEADEKAKKFVVGGNINMLSTSAREEAEAQLKQMEEFNVAGREMYMLLLHLDEYEQGGLDTELFDELGDEAKAYYETQAARVEINNERGELERVHFWVPSYCLLLGEEKKQELLYSVDRHTPGKQITQFFLRREEFYHDLKHQGWLQTFRACRILIRNQSLAKSNQFVLAVTQNILIMVRYSYLKTTLQTFASGAKMEWIVPLFLSALDNGNNFLGVLQCLSCVVVFILYLLHNFPTEQYKRWTEATGLSFGEALEKAYTGDPYWIVQVLYRTPLYYLQDTTLSFYTILFVAAILGLTSSPFFFSIHLLDILTKSKDLMAVTLAVTTNGRSILLTAVLGWIIIYIYTVVAFSIFADDMILDNYPDEDIPMCEDLLVCFLNSVNEGLRGGDIGAIVDPSAPGDALFALKLVYNFSYYVIVITVILNVVFGIIIDTFAELRETNAFIKDNMENNCFICGLSRFTFETKANGFEHHVKKDHNMWQYMFMMIYLRDKDPTEYNGWEQHVSKCMAASDTSFFPSNKAIVLKALQEKEEAEEKEKTQRGVRMAEETSELVHQVEQLQKALESTASKNVVKELEARLVDKIEALGPPTLEAQEVRVGR